MSNVEFVTLIALAFVAGQTVGAVLLTSYTGLAERKHKRKMKKIMDEAMFKITKRVERLQYEQARKARSTSKVTNSKVRSGTKAKSTKTSNKSR